MPDKIPLGNSHVCTIANLHLPPSLSHPDRRSIRSSVATLLCRPRSQVRIICGDLNEHLRPNGGGWLSKALSPTGIWAGYRSPCPPGAGTNHVRASSRELDWILISPDTPCLACSKTLLPGLSTHSALQVDLTIPYASIARLDPCGRQFRHNRATDDQVQSAADVVSLLLWWAAAALLPPDSTVRLCWDGMRLHIPSASRRLLARPRDIQEAAQALAAHVAPCITDCLCHFDSCRAGW